MCASPARSRDTISGGEPAVTNTPQQVLISKPPTPASASVGTFGRSARSAPRCGAVTGSGLNLPAAICAIADEVVSCNSWPTITATRQGAETC